MPCYGYACVSSTDQDCALQEARLRDAGCEVIRAERVSGKSRDGRDELARIMDFLHAGDELVVVKLDRLGRSTRDVLNLVHQGSRMKVCDPMLGANFGEIAAPEPWLEHFRLRRTHTLNERCSSGIRPA